MRDIEEIKNAFEKFSGKHGPKVIVPAEVLSVNEDELMVAVRFGNDAEVDDVRLKSVVKNGNHFVLLPVVGSIIQVARIENSDEYVVIAVDEITAVRCKVDNAEFKIDQDGFTLQQGDDSLGKVLQDLIEQILLIYAPKNTAAIQLIKDRADQFIK